MKTEKILMIFIVLALVSLASISALSAFKRSNAEKIIKMNNNVQNKVEVKNENNEIEIEDGIKVHFININKIPGTSVNDVGDCTLIQDHGVNILIDSGKSNECSDQFQNYDESIEYEIEYLKKYGVDHLDYVINTHLHEDHAGALERIIQEFSVTKAVIVRELDWSKTHPSEINARRLYIELKEVTERQVTEDGSMMHLTEPIEGEKGRINITDDSYMEFYFLPLSEQQPDEEINHTSVMVYYVYKDFKVLVTGDADSRLDSHLKANGIGHTQIFQAQHHTASKGARGYYNSQELLELLTPDICVIQSNRTGKEWFADNDTFGNFNRLRDNEITSYSTAVTGSIIITSDGSLNGYTVEFELSSTPLIQGKWGK